MTVGDITEHYPPGRDHYGRPIKGGTGWSYQRIARDYLQELELVDGRRYRLNARLALRWGITTRMATILIHRARRQGLIPPIGGR